MTNETLVVEPEQIKISVTLVKDMLRQYFPHAISQVIVNANQTLTIEIKDANNLGFTVNNIETENSFNVDEYITPIQLAFSVSKAAYQFDADEAFNAMWTPSSDALNQSPTNFLAMAKKTEADFALIAAKIGWDYNFLPADL